MRRRVRLPVLAAGLAALMGGCRSSLPPPPLIPDGGDREDQASYAAQGQLIGVEPEDTVGGFVDLATQNPGVTRSNRVAVEAPRFVMVTGSVAPELATSAGQVQTDARSRAGAVLHDRRTVSLSHRSTGYGGLASELGPGRVDRSLAPGQRAADQGPQANIAGQPAIDAQAAASAAAHQIDMASRTEAGLQPAQRLHQPLGPAQIAWAHCASEAALPLVAMLLEAQSQFQAASGVDRLDGLRARSAPSRLDTDGTTLTDIGTLAARQDGRHEPPAQAAGAQRQALARHAAGFAAVDGDSGPGAISRPWVPILSDAGLAPEEYGLAITPWRVLSHRHLAGLSRAEQVRLMQAHELVLKLSRPYYPHYILDVHAASEARTSGPAHQEAGIGQPAALADQAQPLDNLLLVKSVDRTEAGYGTVLTFRIAFRNVGQSTLDRVVIVDSLHERLQYVADSARCTLKATITTAPNEVMSTLLRCRLDQALAPGDQGLLTFQARVISWPEADQR